jgi:hypothetical protein
MEVKVAVVEVLDIVVVALVAPTTFKVIEPELAWKSPSP